MKRVIRLLFFVFCASLLFTRCTTKKPDAVTLESIFDNPPEEAKPRAYWLWTHGNFDYAQIKQDLKDFKDAGLAGVDIFDLGVPNKYDMIPGGPAFGSPENLDGIEFALREAQKLDLKMGLSVANGWNAGADWTTPDEMSMQLLIWSDTVAGGEISEIGFPDIPKTFSKSYGTFDLFPELDSSGFPVFYKDVALIAYPVGEEVSSNDIKLFDASNIDRNSVDFDLPEGEWVISRFVVTPMGQKMWAKSINSDGYIMDHFSQQATKHHFEELIGRLEERLGDLSKTSLERLYLCSYESEAPIDWSPELVTYFEKLHGYNPMKYLPALQNIIVDDQETTDRFLEDYRKTVSEMFLNNHYRQARQISNDHGVLLASESGGPGPPLHYVPTEDALALAAVDIMRGEFWNRPGSKNEFGMDELQVVKNIASAAHTYGHTVVEMEAFTSHGKYWEETPTDLKIIADSAFCQGMTRVVYHTIPHSPKEGGAPGWSYGAGTNLGPKMPWWPMFGALNDYFSRTSALLQQGDFVANIVYFKGEQLPNFSPGSKFHREDGLQGYDYDDLNADMLLRASVENGKIVLPSGMKYSLLVLPESENMSVKIARKIQDLLQQGATVLGDKPKTVYGLLNYSDREKELKEITKLLWNSTDEKFVNELGEGRLYVGYSIKDVLAELSIAPDFVYVSSANLDFIHRTTVEREIYFVRSKSEQAYEATLSFRVTGKVPELWDPVSGTRKSVPFTEERGRILIDVNFDPYGSMFIVFREGQPELMAQVGSVKKVMDLTAEWEVSFEHGWGFEPIQQFDSLVDWIEHPNTQIRNYAGVATYKKIFTLNEEDLTGDFQISLSLGRVGEVSTVYINGKEIGTSIFRPHSFTIDPQDLRVGENHLTVDVANTWINKLISERDLDPFLASARSNLKADKNWSSGERPWADKAYKPSGLTGPVELIFNSIIDYE